MKVLKEEWERVEWQFIREFGDRGCTCFTGCAPCGWCTHEGNPLNLEETEEAWEEVWDLKEAYDNAILSLSIFIDDCINKHLKEMKK